jgi:type I restriction-modification system DNA methylase subunit
MPFQQNKQKTAIFMQKAFETIKQLVADFKAQEAAYLSPSYQESRVRQDFIDKFFAALGWDVTHERQKNPYEQEVKIENKVSTQGSQRRADYAFFIAPNFRDVKFYAEAKKPAKNLKDAAFYHQTIRYGWNSGTPIAVLTDFEEFHVLDCRYKPDVHTALDRVIKYFHYSDYANEEKLKEIYYLFARDEVATGSLEKYAATLPKPRGGGPRGKAIQRGLFKGGYQPVDEAFLEELDSYRETLAKAFKKENPDLGSEELTEAVQRTIDRLVFIRFLEDKQIEDPQMINYSETSSAWKKFSANCRALEPKYNGLVFKKHRVLDESGFVPPDDKTFADICQELADPSSPYDFDKIPISILGSIYERFLGKVVHATDKRVKVEEKPEVRKAGGVYYTPQYIVRYIVKETVGKLLYGETEQPPVPVSFPNVSIGNPEMGNTQDLDARLQSAGMTNKKRAGMIGTTINWKTPEEVAKMSFADIACGSGSFLIEVYSELLEYHERYYAVHPEAAKKGDLSTRDGKQVLSLKKRQEILVNNIYGVDIDFQATEVTQLSLYLKLLEEATLNDAVQFSLLKEKLLPDLKNNIVCGNSLIGTDIYDGNLFAPTQPSPSFPNVVVGNPEQGKGLDPRLKRAGMTKEADEGVEKLKPMNFEDAFPTVMKRGGFDAVVGNPPYVRPHNIPNDVKELLWRFYSTFVAKSDMYSCFMEKGLKLTKTSGLFGYIVPHTWTSLESFHKIREYILKQSKIKKLIQLPKKVFQEATVETCIFILEKDATIDKHDNIIVIEKLDVGGNHNIVRRFTQIEIENAYLNNFQLYTKEQGKTLLEKMKDIGLPLDKLVSFVYGFKTADDEKYIHNKNNHKESKLFIRSAAIKRYTYDPPKEYVWYVPEQMKDNKKTARPGEASRFENEKLMVSRMGRSLVIAYDPGGLYVKDAMLLLKKENVYSLKYFLGILNSKLLNYYYSEYFVTIDVLKNAILNLPIRMIEFTNEVEKAKHDHIVSLVEQMLKAKEELATAKLDSDVQRLEHHCTTLDRQIDEAVYELYELSESEIKTVEDAG